MNNRTIYNSFHTALPGEAAGLRTPAASHRPLPKIGYQLAWDRFLSLGQLLGGLEVVFGDLRALLGGSKGDLGRSWGHLGA